MDRSSPKSPQWVYIQTRDQPAPASHQYAHVPILLIEHKQSLVTRVETLRRVVDREAPVLI